MRLPPSGLTGKKVFPELYIDPDCDGDDSDASGLTGKKVLPKPIKQNCDTRLIRLKLSDCSSPNLPGKKAPAGHHHARRILL